MTLDEAQLDDLILTYARAADGIGCERGSFLYDEIKRGLTATLMRANLWSPMETAPRDGTFVLLFCPEDRSTWLAAWQGRPMDGRWYGVDNLGLTREGHDAHDPEVVTGWEVAAWRPLPAAPYVDADGEVTAGGKE